MKYLYSEEEHKEAQAALQSNDGLKDEVAVIVNHIQNTFSGHKVRDAMFTNAMSPEGIRLNCTALATAPNTACQICVFEVICPFAHGLHPTRPAV